MKTFVYKFKISDVIDTYKKRIRESSDKDTYSTAIYEPDAKKKADKNGRTVFVNLNALVSSLIKKDDIKTDNQGLVIIRENKKDSVKSDGIISKSNNITPIKLNNKTSSTPVKSKLGTQPQKLKGNIQPLN